MAGYTEAELRDVVEQYDELRRSAVSQRDQRLREFADAGWCPADLQRVTGYSRETIRLALRPDLRETVNAERRAIAASRRRHRWYIVDSLEELRGPAQGTVTEPARIWDFDEPCDLARPPDVARLYERVLLTADGVDDLRMLVNYGLLIRVWVLMFLPDHVVDMWEGRFPVLAQARLKGWQARSVLSFPPP